MEEKLKRHCIYPYIWFYPVNVGFHVILLFCIIGVFTVAYDGQIEWLVVKGIADYADDAVSTTESWRPFASVMAASVVAHILKDANVFRTWRHYRSEGNECPYNLCAGSFVHRVLCGDLFCDGCMTLDIRTKKESCISMHIIVFFILLLCSVKVSAKHT